jgi:hypothetical protein
MAEGSAGHQGLSKIFNMHNLHYVMWAGMAVMAMAASGGASTLTDIIPAALDSGWQMLSGLGDIGTVGGDIINNTMAGNFDLTYEWGSAAHDMGGMSMMGAEHAGHMAGEAASPAPEFTDSARSLLGMELK